MNKQLAIFDWSCDPSLKPKEDTVVWKLFVDGASRNNPGHAGAGIYLCKNGTLVYKEGFYLGIKTNNEAEYLALLVGVFYAKRVVLPDDLLYIVSDSQLLTKQLRGEYAVKKNTLKPLHKCALMLLSDMRYTICHVKRELNTYADKLANQGIDSNTPLPQDFILLLQQCKIL